jgi:hypothetical protein
MARLIRPNGPTEEATPSNGKKFTLEEIQLLVGGDVQLLEVTPGIYGAIKVTARDKMSVVREIDRGDAVEPLSPASLPYRSALRRHAAPPFLHAAGVLIGNRVNQAGTRQGPEARSHRAFPRIREKLVKVGMGRAFRLSSIPAPCSNLS